MHNIMHKQESMLKTERTVDYKGRRTIEKGRFIKESQRRSEETATLQENARSSPNRIS